MPPFRHRSFRAAPAVDAAVGPSSADSPDGHTMPGRADAAGLLPRPRWLSSGALRRVTVSSRQPGWVARSVRFRARRAGRSVWRVAMALAREALRRSVVRRPASGDEADGEPRVTILLFSAWGMGGTTRAALNLAGYLAGRYEVEIISVIRRREAPFFGEFPPGVKVTALDDQRPEATPREPMALVRRLLRSCPSVMTHSSDRRAAEFNVWTDVRLVHMLRGRRGFLVGTRPALNLMAAELSPPGLILIGEEQMHLQHHARPLRKAMKRLYPKLDAFVVLTDGAKQDYDAHLDGGVRVVRIPNTVRDLGEGSADLDSKTVLAAGRLVDQKGFDLLIPAFAQVAAAYPDWRLKICGRGKWRERLQTMIEAQGLTDVVTLAPPAKDMGAELERASIFALSSRFEGFPLILLEAMSKGTAVVSFACPTGPGDIVEDHRNGLLVPPEEVGAFAAGLLELVEDEELRRRCAAAAVGTARQYRMEAVGPLWEALLRDLREEPARRIREDRAEQRGTLATG